MAVPSASLITCLFFSTEAEAAAQFYVSVFPDSSIEHTSRFPDAGADVQEAHGQPVGSVMVVAFKLNGHDFVALNSKPDKPEMKFNESVSFQIMCDTQDEVDHYWDKLTEGGDEKAQMCGWLRDKFGVSWQVVPRPLIALMNKGGDSAAKAMKAFGPMKKIIIQDILDAVDGKTSG